MNLLKLYTAATFIITIAYGYVPFHFISHVKDYSYMAGIYDQYHGRHICAGLILKWNVVLTAARPMRAYDDRIKYGHLLAYYQWPVPFFTFPEGVLGIKYHPQNKDMWSSIDPFMTKCDMSALLLKGWISERWRMDSNLPDLSNPRAGRLMTLAGDPLKAEEEKDFKFTCKDNELHNLNSIHVGFGSENMQEILHYGDRMRDQYYYRSHITYCAEYFPKEWGNFICVKTQWLGCDAGSALVKSDFVTWGATTSWVGYFVGLAKTAISNYFVGVVQDHYVYGMCSFAIKRDGQTISAFLDLTKKENLEFIVLTRNHHDAWRKEFA